MAQDMGLPWTTTIPMENFMAHEVQHLARIKHELCVSGSYPEISEIISSSPTSSIEDLQLQSSPSFVSKNNHQRIRYNDDHNNQDMLLKTFSNGCQIRGDHQMLMYQIPSSVESSVSYLNDTNSSYRGTFSQIFPTLNIPSLNQSPSSFDINLPALDPFGSPTFNASFSHQPSSLNGHHNIGVGLFRETCLSYGLDQMHHPQEVCLGKISPAFITETTEAKRPASNYTTDAKAATPPKKSKLELRPSCAPLKIRKEKLGDRISALQQMVAPFGKTDTASVLMEAIGYIKFLQNQVETLSVPYMNSTQKANRTSSRGGSIKDVNEETKRDLRSRGLCLVPLSCLSYVTYGGGSIWATP
ncbi:transcription factor bHLH110-like isoform X2 [Cynara cardunculus var. scolymus]|nr:transcription factor bHLH110-like isoform X2 [Cynara cardunculus var. scolymus]